MTKKFLYIALLAVAAGTMTSCNEMLDKEPLDKITVNPAFWSKTANVDAQVNRFYEQFLGYGNGTGSGQFYFQTLGDDQVGANFDKWKFTNVSSSSGTWNDGYTEIRRANLIIAGVASGTLTEAQKTNYTAIARLMRAKTYYELVRAFGDVPYYDHALDPSETEAIYSDRTDRDQVMDKVLEDLNYAAANIAAQNGKVVWSKDLANAIKSEICLYEGTYRKYRTQAENGKAADEAGAKRFLQEAVNAGAAIMAQKYAITPEYGTIYNSTDLSTNSEIIFFKNYVKSTLMHSTIDYTSSSTQMSGMSKDAFDSYLFIDGKPLATTSCNKSDAAVKDENGKMSLDSLLAVRDKRLGAVIDHVLLFQGEPNTRVADDMAMTASTGYGVKKFDNLSIPTGDRSTGNTNYTDAPLYWLAKIYVEYAEAKAELGTITQADLDNTINKLQARAGLPNMTLTPEADPKNTYGVSNLVWEIRRVRRAEMMFDGTRYWDLIRWHMLKKISTDQGEADVLLGANLVNDDSQAAGEIAKVGTYIDGRKGDATLTRDWNARNYFFPIPTGQITLYKTAGATLTQNPGW